MIRIILTLNRIRRSVTAFAVLFCVASFAGESPESDPNVLIVTAHPDDESGMAVTVYKITHDLQGNVDLALVTNGEGGYKYSTLAESVYNLKLTDETVGRRELPAIRKKELIAGGRYIGLQNYFFLNEKDHKYTKDVDIVLKEIWNVEAVRTRLREILLAEHYDYVFTMLPTADTHGHHKGAAILALEAVQSLQKNLRPVVLAVSTADKDDKNPRVFTGLKDYPITSVASGKPLVSVDRTQKFGYKKRLDYKIIVNWLIAEHKSQGTMQLGMNRGDLENFWYYDINDQSGISSTIALFEQLKQVPFPENKYDKH